MQTLLRGALAVALILFLCAPAGAAPPCGDDAGAWYAQGEAQLAQGQIEESAQSFLQAARLDPKNATYVDRAMTLRRVVGMRRFVARSPGTPQWEKSVYSLHLFYVQNGLPQLALELGECAHRQLQTPTSAGWLAESYLELGRNVEAANLLAPYSGRAPQLALLHAIALARLEHADAARSLRDAHPLPAEASPGLLFDAVRVHALLGEGDQALSTLQTCFEKTPAQGLGTVKQRVRTLADFEALRRLPAFETVMQTTSKVTQGCSGGKDCGSCPLRGRCGGRH